jgi:ribonuclease HI
VRAELRGQPVYARADSAGRLHEEGGRVEIRYNADDGRLYRAGARNLRVLDPTPLPDETCAPAAAVPDRTPAVAEGVVVYADGACSGNPGPAGAGLLILDGEGIVERYEYLGEGTNNIAELTAARLALEEVAPERAITVRTDSKYVIGLLQQGWKAKKNGELVAELRALVAARSGRTRLEHVRGHSGDKMNDRADELARMAVATRSSGRKVVKASR